ncbi:cyclic nucleotide-binding domain-containing protein [Thalassospira lucentensis]|uniref:cyclic nucleotide-binding domain-containing protein n=1 Tax=Thalassospira lucentensis TaxID=168935 RepID=UPI0003B358C4|nr:cyclic nucleotide-binding domain-containing protein [Thalassospira lucentensis]RCK28657.1 hypothetical protein TH1_09300 [Thalassospira lucentensis MCCC 1A00383 = DSM 14000]
MIKGIRQTRLETARFDIGAACVGMLATLPQAVAYGLIAFYPLGPQWASFGISASIGSAILFGIISGMFGVNPFLVSGPRAVTALVLASAIQIAITRGSSAGDAIVIAFVAVLAAGIFQFVAGLLRLGNVASYIPAPVLSGFVNASALLVLINTLPTALGSLTPDITAIFEPDENSILFFAIAVSLTTISFQFIAARTIRFVPAAIVGLVGGTAIYYIGVSIFPLANAPLIGTTEFSEIWRMPILIKTTPVWNELNPNIDIVITSALTIGLLSSFDTVILFVLGMSKNPVRRSYLGSRVHAHRQRKVAIVECLEKEGHRIAVLELQGALFFGSCSRLRSTVSRHLETGIDYLILDFRHVTSIDSSGSEALRAIHQQCLDGGKHLFLSSIQPERRLSPNKQRSEPNPNSPPDQRDHRLKPRWIWLNLDANGVIKAVSKENFFAETDAALAHCEELLLRRFCDKPDRGIHRVFAKSLLLNGMTRDQITTLGYKAQRQRFKKGDLVFQQNDTCNRAYFLIFGRMDVVINVPGTGRQKRINTITEGTLFGEVALLDGAPRSATIVATTDALCLSLDGTDFAALRQDHQDIVTRLLLNLNRILASRLRQANMMISELEQ